MLICHLTLLFSGMKKVLFYMFSVLCAFCMSACSDDSNVDDTTLVIDVPVITDITFNSAEVKAVIKDAEFVERGVCYSTFKNPNMLNNKIVAGDATDEFSVVLKDLSSNTKYYVRSYAVLQDNSVVYSGIVDFSTLANEGDELLGKYTPPMYSDNYMAINNWAITISGILQIFMTLTCLKPMTDIITCIRLMLLMEINIWETVDISMADAQRILSTGNIWEAPCVKYQHG